MVVNSKLPSFLLPALTPPSYDCAVLCLCRGKKNASFPVYLHAVRHPQRFYVRCCDVRAEVCVDIGDEGFVDVECLGAG
jgi:hypothetical protein